MAEPELLLDSNIRLWVVLPIVFITFLVGVIRHYVSILLQSDKKLTLEQVSDRWRALLALCIATQDVCLPDWSPVLCLMMVYAVPWLQFEFIIHAGDGKTQGSAVDYL